MDLWKTLQIIRNRKWAFLAATVLGLLIIVAAPRGARVAPVYTSTAKVLLTPQTGTVQVQGGTVPGMAESLRTWFADEATLREIVTSEELLSRVIDRSGVQTTWDRLRPQVALKSLSPEYRQVTMFQLAVTAEKPDIAELLANNLVQEFITFVSDLPAREYSSNRRFLEQLIAEAQKKVEQAEDKLIARREERGGDPEDYVERRRALEQQRTQLKTEIGLLESQQSSLADFLDGTSSTPPWSIIEKSDATLQAQGKMLSERKLKLVELQEIYTADSRQVLEEKEKLRQVEALYHGEVKTYVRSLLQEQNNKIAEKQAALDLATQELTGLIKSQLTPEEKLELAKLEREAQMWQENYLSLTQQLYQTRVSEQSSKRQGAITVLERPRTGVPSSGKIPTSLKKALLMGFPFCLLLGAGVALLLDYLSGSFKIRPRVEAALELPVIAVIPSIPQDLSRDWESVKRTAFSPAIRGGREDEDRSRHNGSGVGNHTN